MVTPRTWTLEPHPRLTPPQGSLCLVLLDGLGLGPPDEGNAWHRARTPFLDRLAAGPVAGQLRAHGTAVGLSSDEDVGNSEVAHNAIGAGRIFDQGSKLVQQALISGRVFGEETWSWLMEACHQGGTLHLVGLLSDGNVHSHVEHAYRLMEAGRAAGVRRLRLHVLLDGRDVGETSALEYVAPLEERLAELRDQGVDARVASGGGRMTTTMDRYEADWSIVERGWQAHVLGEGRPFGNLTEAVTTYRQEHPGILDQYLPSFVIVEEADPVGPILDGDAVILFNFRGDRAQEVSRAFETPETEWHHFDRVRLPRVRFAGMMQYDGDLEIPRRFLVHPPTIRRTVGEYLARNQVRQLAISETQKYGHVTYFFNGNRSGYFDESVERYVEIPSDRVDFATRPAMKAAEITEAALREMDDFRPRFVRLNYPNGDMVGHTGNMQAVVRSLEAVDQALERLVQGVLMREGICIVAADHGNCEEMAERDRRTGELLRDADGSLKARTSHTRNPVPCYITGGGAGERYAWDPERTDTSIASLAATVLNLLGYREPLDYLPAVVRPL